MFKTTIFILAVLGGALAVLVAVLAACYLYALRKLTRRMRDTVQELNTLLADATDQLPAQQSTVSLVPPLRIYLESARDRFLDEHPLSIAASLWLEDNSYSHVGDFVIEEMDDEHLRVFLSHDRELVAAIRFPAGDPGPYLEFCFELPDGGRGGVGNPPITTVAPPDAAPAKHIRESYLGQPELLWQMQTEARRLIAEYGACEVADEDIAEFFEQAHAAEMDYRLEHGGLSSGEILDCFAAQGVQASGEDVLQLQRQWQSMIERHLIDHSPRSQNHVQAGGAILAVFDASQAEYLIEQLVSSSLLSGSSSSGKDDSPAVGYWTQELEELLARFPPREAVARFRPLLPIAQRFRLIDQLQRPIPADLYLLTS